MEYDIITVSMNPAIDKTLSVEDFTLGRLNRVKSIRIDPGGKGINVSKALSTYGMKQIATGIVGGTNGKQLLSMLKKYGFPHDFLKVSGETRINLKIHDMKTGSITEINEPGNPVETNDLEIFFRKLKKHLEKSKIIVFSGSLPATISNCFYAVCVQMSEKMGNKVILDTDSDSLELGIQSKPYAIKPNITELERYLGKTLNTVDEIYREIRKIYQTGVQIILVSMGEKGSIFHQANQTYMVKPLSIDVRSTVGSGDAMVAALAYCIHMDFPPERTAKITMAAGCLTAAKDGSQIAEWNEIQQFYQNVYIEEL